MNRCSLREPLSREQHPRHRCARLAVLAIALASLASGCTSEEPRYRLDREGDVLKSATPEQEKFLSTVLWAYFGDPDNPPPEDSVYTELGFENKNGVDRIAIARAAGPAWSDETGYNRGLFRRHCVHCHGVSGDGEGPTAIFLTPYPRDYRRGIFKYKSTYGSSRPTHEDLSHIIREGIRGTAMPSFALLPQQEIDALAKYVKFLSLRGEIESALRRQMLEEEVPVPMSRDEILDAMSPIVERWKNAPQNIITPAPRVAFNENLRKFMAEKFQVKENASEWDLSKAINEKLESGDLALAELEKAAPYRTEKAAIARGKELFLGDVTKCTNCHGPTALGDGQANPFDKNNLDDWNKVKIDKENEYVLPIQALKPRNLRLGIYHGGNRNIDLYRRIYGGIFGAPMPSFGGAPTAPKGSLTPEDIWCLVDYVRSLPYDQGYFAVPEQKGLRRPRN